VTNSDGTLDITSPDTTAIAQAISSNSAVQGLVLPNWDTEVQSQLIKTVPATSKALSINTVARSVPYSINILFQGGLQSQVERLPPVAILSQLSYVSSQVQSALTDTLAIPTPHRSPTFRKALCG